MTLDRPSRQAADALARARVRAQIRGIDVTDLDAAALEAAIVTWETNLDASPPWLLPGTTAVAETAAAMLAAADVVIAATTRSDGVAAAAADVLRNAAGHLPEFSAGAARPYGCVICGCADGVGACDTWLAGIRLAAAIPATDGVGAGSRPTQAQPCGRGHRPGEDA